ncbi:DNA-binding protein WhiA [Corynebacterium pseudodiphtheriticum]|uniref:DNA-binding protein WhiA n=2 Tax=Corynebacterium TaxID=1716 RepID=UPI00201BD7AD|nr:DNA-binding protein WhiA [Corynebacterium pseudodiphtheriticum]MDC7088274.1 DNA-binding protein WhiA [Corynebacterium pseudodiphtheriticum]MDK4241506.1 DNA-binding protein WhiA [Corynebacterium pseudodiphtheriticum]MDK4321610.1 DNA-binding protein WhiA [Corynebacterium pseudodiphtheriticum]MDK8500081.1 DNA-binding protein WhiA [Corynebacterium pseudodiphtheriticum]MDK8544825.1 DNA-binding protein WhiA [Corynebacterium pseudodiphtheriticum]
MGLTEQVQEELTRVVPTKQSARSAEVAAILRLASTMEVVGDALTFEVELNSRAVAERLAKDIEELFNIVIRPTPTGLAGTHKTPRYQLRISRNAKTIARRLGLVTKSGHPVVGLPPQVISGTIADNEAAWRGAFLAQGLLTEPGRSSSLEVACPCQEAALALVGCARRLGISAKTKESRGTDRVVIRDGEAIGALLTRMGAQMTRLEWDEKRLRREARASQNRLANFDDANLRRSARAAVTAAARVHRAMEILGDDVPEHLAEAGNLRVKYRQASLEELGRLGDPQMTKDAVAGRIRRLLSMADKRAEELGIPDTSEGIDEDLFDDDLGGAEHFTGEGDSSEPTKS